MQPNMHPNMHPEDRSPFEARIAFSQIVSRPTDSSCGLAADHPCFASVARNDFPMPRRCTVSEPKS
jgi:hypothetical protein